MVEVAEIVVHEAYKPNLIAHLFDADGLAGEDGTDYFLAIEADAAACGHGHGVVVERVVEFRQTDIGTC